MRAVGWTATRTRRAPTTPRSRCSASGPVDHVTGRTADGAVAAEAAETQAHGPGTFVPAFLDALASVGPATIRERARIDGGTG